VAQLCPHLLPVVPRNWRGLFIARTVAQQDTHTPVTSTNGHHLVDDLLPDHNGLTTQHPRCILSNLLRRGMHKPTLPRNKPLIRGDIQLHKLLSLPPLLKRLHSHSIRRHTRRHQLVRDRAHHLRVTGPVHQRVLTVNAPRLPELRPQGGHVPLLNGGRVLHGRGILAGTLVPALVLALPLVGALIGTRLLTFLNRGRASTHRQAQQASHKH